jgi:hypothetical protein
LDGDEDGLNRDDALNGRYIQQRYPNDLKSQIQACSNEYGGGAHQFSGYIGGCDLDLSYNCQFTVWDEATGGWKIPGFWPGNIPTRADRGAPFNDGTMENYHIYLKVTDGYTDTQVIAYQAAHEEISSMNHTGAAVLFEEGSVWAKVFAVTPTVLDTRYNEEWTRSSPPDSPPIDSSPEYMASTPVTVYVGGGCKRTDASTLGQGPYSSITGSYNTYYYPKPIEDYLTLTVDYDCQNPDNEPAVWRVFKLTYDPGDEEHVLTEDVTSQIPNGGGGTPTPDDEFATIRSLLPFPPGDSVGYHEEIITRGTTGPVDIDYLLHQNKDNGARYSFFIVNLTDVPCSANCIYVKAEYSCVQDANSRSGAFAFRDNSTVAADYLIPHVSCVGAQEATMTVSGYYDAEPDPYTGAGPYVTGGQIQLEVMPDEVAGYALEVDSDNINDPILPISVYAALTYPATHELLLKQKAADYALALLQLANPGDIELLPTERDYFWNDFYGYNSAEFNYDERCNLPACDEKCTCRLGDPFNPACKDMSEDEPVEYNPNRDGDPGNDCICYWEDGCEDHPCSAPYSSGRNYHEFEKEYYDFTQFYTQSLSPPDDYIVSEENPDGRGIIIDSVTVEPTHQNTVPARDPAYFNPRTYSGNQIFFIVHPNFKITVNANGVLNGRAIQVGNDATKLGKLGYNILRNGDITVAYNPTGDAAVRNRPTVFGTRHYIDFTGHNIAVGDFTANGGLKVYTHFRQRDIPLSSLVQRTATTIDWTVSSSSFSMSGSSDESLSPTVSSGALHVGDEVTIDVSLAGCAGGQDVQVSVPNYENQLQGVKWDADSKAYVTTGGASQVTFTLGYAPAQVTLDFPGSFGGGSGCSPSKAGFVVSATEVNSPISSVDFILLLLVMFLLLFFWRWFRGGRMDFYGMWQELKGEPSD